ncbi:MAG: epoxyqueuosine reductase [Synergistetes bacterium]|nr:epoxyqueuosine reductase [Synergistota bacterium]
MGLKEKLKNLLNDRVKDWGGKTSYREPILKVASVFDPLWKRLKELCPFHFMPWELLEEAKSVVVFFLPFSEEVIESNQKGYYSSREWAVAYLETNAFLYDISLEMIKLMEEHGYKGVSIKPTHNFDKEKLVSYWSHRHAGFIAGMGTFGLNNMLITEKGCGGRLGSFVTDALLDPDDRPLRESCLFKRNKSCALCVKRCPVGALKVDGFDRFLCHKQCLEVGFYFSDLGKVDVCGKCITHPCALGIPQG